MHANNARRRLEWSNNGAPRIISSSSTYTIHYRSLYFILLYLSSCPLFYDYHSCHQYSQCDPCFVLNQHVCHFFYFYWIIKERKSKAEFGVRLSVTKFSTRVKKVTKSFQNVSKRTQKVYKKLKKSPKSSKSLQKSSENLQRVQK